MHLTSWVLKFSSRLSCTFTPATVISDGGLTRLSVSSFFFKLAYYLLIRQRTLTEGEGSEQLSFLS